MYFKTNSGPYWTPELSQQYAELIRAYDGDCPALTNLLASVAARAHHTMLAPLAHVAYLEAVPIIRKRHSDEQFESFKQDQLVILRKSKFFPDETTEHQVSWTNWDRR